MLVLTFQGFLYLLCRLERMPEYPAQCCGALALIRRLVRGYAL